MSTETIIWLAAAYLPTLFAAIVLVAIAWRGRLRWSSPRCARCEYDLRHLAPDYTTTCPECGANLQKSRAVYFSRAKCRWSLLTLALLVLVLPWAVFGGYFWHQDYQTRAAARTRAIISTPSAVSTAEMLEIFEATPTGMIREGVFWQELKGRLKDGELTGQQIEQTIEIIISRLGGRWTGSLDYQRGFLKHAFQSGAMTADQVVRFCDAYFREGPEIGPLQNTREGQEQIPYEISHNYSSQSPLGVSRLYSLAGVKIGGDDVEVVSKHINQSI